VWITFHSTSTRRKEGREERRKEMKCEIKKNGIMHVTAETELEGYALEMWCEDYPDVNGKDAPIKFDWSLANVNDN